MQRKKDKKRNCQEDEVSRDSGDSTKKIDKSVSGQLQSCQEEEQDMSRYVKICQGQTGESGNIRKGYAK